MTLQLNTQTATRGSALVIVCAAMLWGTVGIVTRLIQNTTPEADAVSISFFRMAFSVPALAFMAWRAVGPALFRVPGRDLGLMVIIGAMMAWYQFSYFAALQWLPVSVAIIITICSAPVMVAVLAAVFLGERFTARLALALAVAITGTVLLSGLTPETIGQRTNEITGMLFALGSGFGYAVLILCSRALAGRYHPLHPIAIGFGVGAALLLPFALATGLTLNFSWSGWGMLLYLGLVPTAFAYGLFLNGLRHTSATTASILTLAEPLTSPVLAALLFGERLAPLAWLGAALLLGAMGLLFRRSN
ncbi:MAG: DMT family transporter [Anaerolineales bacterium]